MGDFDIPYRSSARPERKHRRFDAQRPVRLKYRAEGCTVEVEAASKNISIGGIVVKTESMILLHTIVTFVIVLKGKGMFHPIHLAGEGDVVRIEFNTEDEMFTSAVRCQSPITQLSE